MKLKKTLLLFTTIWFCYILALQEFPDLAFSPGVYQYLDIFILLALLILIFNLLDKFLPKSKCGKRSIFLITIFFYPVLWALIYPFLPYGNHFMHAWGGQPSFRTRLFYSQTASKFILKLRTASCDLPFLDHFGVHEINGYAPGKNRALADLIEISADPESKLTSIQNEFIVNQIYKTIETCDSNVETEGFTPLGAAIYSNRAEIVAALLARGANINSPTMNMAGQKYKLPLYFAETLLQSEPDEVKQKSLIKIIDLLKQAGAKSEMTEFKSK